MDLHKYFESTRGLGILATADSDGRVDMAIYSRPHVMDDGSIAFIMGDRRSHRNLQSNPGAAYLFKEGPEGYSGTRLYLEKTGEEKNSPLIDALRRKKMALSKEDTGTDRFLVFFRIIETRPLVGDEV